MKRLVIGLLVVLMSFACNQNKADKAADGNATKKSALPKGLIVNFNPDTRVIESGATLKGNIDNKTGIPYTYEVTSPQNCGELKLKDESAVEFTFVAKSHEADCTDEIKLALKGGEEIVNASFTIKVKAGAQEPELELRPDPIPDTWLMVNDYENTMQEHTFTCTRKPTGGEENVPGEEVEEELKLNLLKATFDTWQYEGASCTYADLPEGVTGVAALAYDLPYDDAFCGMFENLGLGKDCETDKRDLGNYQALTFLAKSGDAAEHKLYVEIVQWEKYAEFHQGKAAEFGPITIPADRWKRFQIPMEKLCRDDVQPFSVKSVSFKVKRAGHPDKGVILIDNVAFIKKVEE